jgi:hypothetical protein
MLARAVALAVLLVSAAAQAAGLPVECLRVGQGSVDGTLDSITSGKLALQTADGRASPGLEEFREIVFTSAAGERTPPAWTLWTAAGGRMLVSEVTQKAGSESLDVAGSGWEGHGIPLDSVQALASRAYLDAAPAAEREAFELARANPPSGSDTLMVTRDNVRQTVSCIVDSFGADGVTVEVGGQKRTVPWAQVDWLVLSPAGAAAPQRTSVVELVDGTALSVKDLSLEGGRVSAKDGPASYSVEAARLSRIRVASDAYVYLSDLKAARIVQTPPVDVAWTPRLDRSISGGPLTMQGRIYPKGIGMYGGTRMSYQLPAGYNKLYALVGVDDSAGGQGRVTFRVLLDGKEAFASGPLSRDDTPVAVAVDLNGARDLTLEAAFGTSLDASGGLGDWAEARVTK